MLCPSLFQRDCQDAPPTLILLVDLSLSGLRNLQAQARIQTIVENKLVEAIAGKLTGRSLTVLRINFNLSAGCACTPKSIDSTSICSSFPFLLYWLVCVWFLVLTHPMPVSPPHLSPFPFSPLSDVSRSDLLHHLRAGRLDQVSVEIEVRAEGSGLTQCVVL